MSFANRLGNLISTGLEFAFPAGKVYLRHYLRNQFCKSAVRSGVKLAFTFAAILLVIFSPLGLWWSEFLASLVFIGVFVWSLVNFILLVKNNWRLPVCIFEEGDLSLGIISFVKERWCNMGFGISVYDTVRKGKSDFFRPFNRLPSLENLVRDYISYVIKDVLLFALVFTLYFVIMSLVIKPLLLHVFADLTTWEIYLFPFVEIFRVLESF